MTKVILATLGEKFYRSEAGNLTLQLLKAMKSFLFREQDAERFQSETLWYPLEEF